MQNEECRMKKRKPSMKNGTIRGDKRRIQRKAQSKPEISFLARAGEWVTTGVAAKLAGYSQRHIGELCEQGFFVKGKDWKQRPRRPGSRRGGRILIRHSALKKLDGEG